MRTVEIDNDLHDFYFVIHHSNGVFKSEKCQSMDTCIRMCEKKLRELHINHSDGVELGYTTEYGNTLQRKPELGEVVP